MTPRSAAGRSVARQSVPRQPAPRGGLPRPSAPGASESRGAAPRRRARAGLRASALAALVAAVGVASSCRKTQPPPKVPDDPSLRLYFLSTLAGAMEPCGCRKDMLGGVDHAAALLRAKTSESPPQLLLAAGPLFFMNPTLDEVGRDQELWKAEALATSLKDLQLGAWAPGVNDFAAGRPRFDALAKRSGATPVAANLDGTPATAAFEVGGYRVGVAGIGAAPAAGGADGAAAPAESTGADPLTALKRASAALGEGDAQIRVALLSVPRGQALRLAEQVPGFDVMALGHPAPEGEKNDPAFPPTLVGDTLVLQAPNHLQGVAYVDFYVVDGDFEFGDATGIRHSERVDALKGRVDALARRLSHWRDNAKPTAEELANRQRELETLQQKLASLERERPKPPTGSRYEYHLSEVREAAGTDARVTERLESYYRKVNDHNRTAFADRKPEPVPEGESGYVGVQACASCHEEAKTFWEGTGHSDAYETLSVQFKEFNLDCVSCHVTGYGRPGGSTVTHVDNLKDVQCEACHGPGSRHVESGGDTELIRLTPEESTCQGCHYPPHVADEWTAAAAWPKILGPGHGKPAPDPPDKPESGG